jgi:hypothetical protein
VLRGIDGKVKNMERFLEGGGREHPKHLGFYLQSTLRIRIRSMELPK